MTSNVITRWYRPPELLFGAKFYSSAVDVWSLGLVFAELIIRSPFLAGQTDIHQIELISQWIGSPTEQNWPGVTKLPEYIVAAPNGQTGPMPEQGDAFFLSTFGSVGPEGVEVLRGMLKLDPRKRVSCREVLEHRWFKIEPKPTPIQNLPRRGGKEGESKVGSDLKRRWGGFEEEEGGRGKKVARKLDFGA